MSASYVAGFNNRAAAIAAATISLAVLLWTWRTQHMRLAGGAGSYGHEGEKASGPLCVACYIAGTCAFCFVCERLLAVSRLRYLADAGYFIEQISAHVEYGRHLYSQLEFAYGPLLFYPTAWIQHGFHCSWLAAYFCTLALEQSAGVLELAFLLNELRVSTELRRFALPLFALAALNPLLGLNYTLFRYLTPFFCVAFASRLRHDPGRAATLFLGGAMCFGISVEIGVAFCAGALVLIAWRSWLHGWSSLWMCVLPVAGGAGFLRLFGGGYLGMLRSFAKGALNLPVAPYPHLLIFVFGVVWVVPRFVGGALRRGREEQGSVLACYAAGLALLPAALGRCDPLHVFFDGAGLLVLSLAAITGEGRTARIAWVSALLLLVGWEQGVTNRIFRYRTADTLSAAVMPHVSPRMSHWILQAFGSDTSLAGHLAEDGDSVSPQEEDGMDMLTLARYTAGAGVITPIEITPAAECALKRSQLYRPGYYAFMVDVFSGRSEQDAIGRINQAQWALLPSHYAPPFLETPANLTDIQGFTFPYRQRHPVPFDAGRAFSANLQQHWLAVNTIGDYVLWKKK